MKKNSAGLNNHIVWSLYRLVNSMSPVHKSGLKKQARSTTGTKEQKYLILFDDIDRFVRTGKEMTNLLPALLESKKFGNNTSLNALCGYLFDKILEQIRNTSASVSQRHNRLLQVLQDIHFLFHQDMYKECYKLVMEAKSLANEIDRPAYILELQIWEARLSTRVKNTTWKLQDMQQEMEMALDRIRQTSTAFLQSQQLYVALKTTDGTVGPEIEKIMEHAVTGKQYLPEHTSPRLHYWRLVEIQYFHELQLVLHRKNARDTNERSERSDPLFYLKQNLDFMAGKGKVIAEEEPINYFSALENYMSKSLELKDEDSIQLLESEFLKGYIKKEDILRYRIICYFKMLYFIRFNQFDQACQYVEDLNLEANLKSREHLISDFRMSVIRYCCVQAFFLNKKFEEAFKWTNYVIENPRSQSSPLVFLMCELIYPVCLLETQRLKSINSHLNNLLIKYKRRESGNNFLHELLMTMRYAALPKNIHYTKITEKRRQKLETYLSKNRELAIYGPVLAWIDSKISEKPLSEEIRKYNS